MDAYRKTFICDRKSLINWVSNCIQLNGVGFSFRSSSMKSVNWWYRLFFRGVEWFLIWFTEKARGDFKLTCGGRSLYIGRLLRWRVLRLSVLGLLWTLKPFFCPCLVVLLVHWRFSLNLTESAEGVGKKILKMTWAAEKQLYFSRTSNSFPQTALLICLNFNKFPFVQDFKLQTAHFLTRPNHVFEYFREKRKKLDLYPSQRKREFHSQTIQSSN